ncbi:MAG: hypothetical protein A2V85_00820 [Chloroflexi bacterium RBG_16_72_14]|nr:MAG: hypothetical protein A2V85_00820 [Chloroflexi bacterium RBG_16_72_14]
MGGTTWPTSLEEIAMRRTLGPTLAVMLLFVAGVAPVAAAHRQAISITAITTFDEVPDTFTADGLPGCDEGIVEDGPANVVFTPGPGVFAGFKVFWCDGSDSGFVLRLNALFGPGGSTGTWSVIAAWGTVEGMHGAGKLVGDPIEGGVIDRYAGIVTS